MCTIYNSTYYVLSLNGNFLVMITFLMRTLSVVLQLKRNCYNIYLTNFLSVDTSLSCKSDRLSSPTSTSTAQNSLSNADVCLLINCSHLYKKTYFQN